MQKYSSNPRHCAEILSHYFGRPSHRFAVSHNMFLTVFDMGSNRNGYKETPNYITYRRISQESYHDGEGHVYVVNPWDMCGIFEFYCHTEEKELDEETNILGNGMLYRGK